MSSEAAYIDFTNVKYIFFDFDGIMTDNRVLVSEDGKEAVFCNRAVRQIHYPVSVGLVCISG